MLSGRFSTDINNRKQRCKKRRYQGANERARSAALVGLQFAQSRATVYLRRNRRRLRDPRQYDEEHEQGRALRMEN